MRTDDILRELAELRGDWQPQDFSERLAVTENRICVASDVHIPYHDEELLADMLERCRVERTEAIVWLGDLLDCPTYSSFGTDDKTTTFERELDIVAGVIRTAAKMVPTQYWSMGNHEMRFIRANTNQLGLAHVARLAGLSDLMDDGRLIISENPTLDYYHDTWMLTHPKSYGPKPLVVPGDIASQHQRNVASAHAHHWAMGVDKTGKFTVVESGGLFNPRLFKYIQHNITTHRAWVQGYLMLDYGTPRIYRGETLAQRMPTANAPANAIDMSKVFLGYGEPTSELKVS